MQKTKDTPYSTHQMMNMVIYRQLAAADECLTIPTILLWTQ